MQLESLEKKNSHVLAEMIIDKGHPDKNSSSRILPIYNIPAITGTPQYQELIGTLTLDVTKSNDASTVAQHRTCLEYIIKSLIVCIFRYEWLALPTNDTNFADDELLNHLGFSRRRMERCIETLVAHGIIELGRKGFKSGNAFGTEGKSSQFFPTPAFIHQVCEFIYAEFADFDTDENEALYQFRRFEEADLPSLESYEYKIDIIRQYNHFMRQHSWALKSPSYRSIKDFDCRSGRMLNNYQSLANRRIPIRINTLLDGHPICEPDFSANHLRMAAFLMQEKLPEDPYTQVAEELHLSREQVKYLVTRCIGATSLKQKGGIIVSSPKHKIPILAKSASRIITTFEGMFPWLTSVFFHDFGSRLQYLEGEIALKMMQWSVDQEIPLIAVHDAYAVRNFDEEETYNQMQIAWNEVLNKALENNFIANSNYTTEIVYERNKAA